MVPRAGPSTLSCSARPPRRLPAPKIEASPCLGFRLEPLISVGSSPNLAQPQEGQAVIIWAGTQRHLASWLRPSPPRERSSRQAAPLTGLPSRAPHRNRFPWGPQAGLVRVGIVIDLGGIDLHHPPLRRQRGHHPRPLPVRIGPARRTRACPAPRPALGAGASPVGANVPTPSRDRRRALPIMARGGLGMDPVGPRPLLQARGCG